MKILERASLVKEQLVMLENEINMGLNGNARASSLAKLEVAREQINQLAIELEAAAQSEQVELEIESDLLTKMINDPLYANISLEDRNKIANKIFEDPELKFLDEKGLKEYIRRSLSVLDIDSLVRKAYTREDMIRIGKALMDPQAPTRDLYERGKKALIEESDTPSGFEQVLTDAYDAVINSNSQKTAYLKHYYEI